jgi:acetoin utilization deacetylase AcuC-like enzyme
MLPFKLIYHEGYDLNLGGHVFPSQKYRMVRERLLSEKFAEPEDFIQPEPATNEDLLLVHERGWITRLREDVAVAIRRMQKEGLVERALVVNTDVHHGNGTAAIFADDPSVFTLSIHQYHNYPQFKPPSDLDIHLDDGVGDDEYCQLLEAACKKAMGQFHPQLVMYVAGADPYRNDQLGGLALTIEGLKARDRLVYDLACECQVPIATTFAGGYARDVADTVTIHDNTVKAAFFPQRREMIAQRAKRSL